MEGPNIWKTKPLALIIVVGILAIGLVSNSSLVYAYVTRKERTLAITDYMPNTDVKFLETAFASKGASLTKLIHKSDLTKSQIRFISRKACPV